MKDQGMMRKHYPDTELRQRRRTYGIRLVEVAGAAGMPMTRLSHIETGKTNATPGEIDKIIVAIDGIARERGLTIDDDEALDRESLSAFAGRQGRSAHR